MKKPASAGGHKPYEEADAHASSPEEILRQSEQRLRQIIDLVPHFIFAKDVNGHFILVNRALAEAYGTTVERLTGATDADFAHSDDEVRHFREDDLAVIHSGRPKIIPEEVITDSSGQTRILSTTKIPFVRFGSDLPAVLGVSVDITERKQVEQALANERNLFMDMVNSQPAGAYRLRIHSQRAWNEEEWVEKTETHYKLELVSDLFCRILGKTREQCEASATVVVDAIHPEDRADFVQCNGVALETLQLFGWEARLLRNGEVVWVHFSSMPRVMSDGDVIWTGILLDITALKRAEDAHRRVRVLESLGIAAGGIAHDFNNLLTGVFGNIELARMQLPDHHPAQASLRSAHQALDRARSLTTRLLTFAKGGSPVLEDINIRQEICDTVRFHLSGSHVAAEFSVLSDLWPVKADKGQLAEVISNLTINAREAMPSGGTLWVEASNAPHVEIADAPELHGDHVRLVFRDEGVGIPRDIIAQVFDPYFSTKKSGSGLGLAIVHGIVRKHRGHIGVASSPGKGTTFTVYLPVNREARIRTDAVEPPITKAEIQAPHVRRVLVMDDEPVIRTLVAHMLERLGYEVETVADGVTAINAYESARQAGRRFDLTIMDLTIPGGMGGRETMANLRAIDSTARVIVTSGYSSDPVLANFAAYGFSGKLAKPFNIRELGEALKAAIMGTDNNAQPDRHPRTPG